MHLTLLTSQRSLIQQLPYVKVVSELPTRYTSTSHGRASANVWISRLEFEKSQSEPVGSGGLPVDIHKTWKDARLAVQGQGILEVWTWGLPSEGSIEDEEKAARTLKDVEVCSSPVVGKDFH